MNPPGKSKKLKRTGIEDALDTEITKRLPKWCQAILTLDLEGNRKTNNDEKRKT